MTRTLVAAIVAIVAAACAPDGGDYAQLSEPVLGEPIVKPTITFVEHGPSEARDRTPDTTLDRCDASCAAEWQRTFEQCRTQNIVAQDDEACRTTAHEAVAVCVEVRCAARIRRQASPICALTCDDEAHEVTTACTQTHGYTIDCINQGDDVYQTCFEAECGSPSPYVGSQGTVEGYAAEVTPPDTSNLPTQADQPGDSTCAEKCQAFDLKMYLQCVSQAGANSDACRERDGQVLHECVVLHCEGVE